MPLLTQGQGNAAAAATTPGQSPVTHHDQPPAPAVPKAVQERILRGEFVDFSSLLPEILAHFRPNIPAGAQPE